MCSVLITSWLTVASVRCQHHAPVLQIRYIQCLWGWLHCRLLSCTACTNINLPSFPWLSVCSNRDVSASGRRRGVSSGTAEAAMTLQTHPDHITSVRHVPILPCKDDPARLCPSVRCSAFKAAGPAEQGRHFPVHVCKLCHTRTRLRLMRGVCFVSSCWCHGAFLAACCRVLRLIGQACVVQGLVVSQQIHC